MEKTTATTTSTKDPRSGFCRVSRTFHSLRPEVALPPEDQRLSVTSFALSLLSSLALPDSHPLLVDASTGAVLPIASFLSELRSLASALRSPSLAVSRGQVAFVLSPARLDVPLLYLALLSVDAVVCPSNPASTREDIARQFRLVSPSIVFATSSTAALLPPSDPARVILLDSPEFLRMLRTPPALLPDPVEIRQDDTAVILFSSGTTGPSKAAETTHRNYIAMIAVFDADERRRKERGEGVGVEVMLLTAPMFHSLGCFVALKAVALGETTVVGGRAGTRGLAAAARRHGATTMTAAPPLVVAMSGLDGAEEMLRGLRKVFCGGAPLQVSAWERFRRRFPWIDVAQGYGLTEGGGIARMITSEECMNFRSVGKLNENVIARIVDPITGKALPAGHRGELWMGGPTIMKGYLGDDKGNASTFSADGWLKSGDLGYIDSDGFVYIVDRLKELIKYKAYQVAPAELEQLLYTLPEILDAAVVPYPNDEAGEVPMAFVVKRPGSEITGSQIMDIIAKQVAPYKRIRKVSFVDSIPKNPSGKILRKELASRALAGDSPAVSRL